MTETPRQNADYERRCAFLTEALAYAAECVAAQTFDVKSLGKGRKECLVRIVNGMLDAADGKATYGPKYGTASSEKVRERFPELRHIDGSGADTEAGEL